MTNLKVTPCRQQQKNAIQGWCDVPLAEEGKKEATEAGKLLAAAGFRFDVAYASVLKRACTSLHRLLDGSGQPYIPIKTDWRLNERWAKSRCTFTYNGNIVPPGGGGGGYDRLIIVTSSVPRMAGLLVLSVGY